MAKRQTSAKKLIERLQGRRKSIAKWRDNFDPSDELSQGYIDHADSQLQIIEVILDDIVALFPETRDANQ